MTGATTQRGEIKPLTGIRGLAACWVILYHVHALKIDPGDNAEGLRQFGWSWWLLVHGYLAVDLFFVLSGFVMGLSYGRFVREGWNKKNYAAFLMRRFARVYPLYGIITLAIVVAILLGVSKAVELSASNIFQNFTLIQAWGLSHNTDSSYNPPAWSISVEFAAYLLFPLLTLPILKWRWPWAAVATCLAIAILFSMQFVPDPPKDGYRYGPLDIAWMPSHLPLLRCICEFSLGLVTCRLSTNAALMRHMARTLPAYGITALLIILLFIPGTDIPVILLLPLFLLALASGENAVTRLVGGRTAFFLGEISFSLYLLHWQLMRVRFISARHLESHLGEKWADITGLTLFYLSAILLSWLAYRFWEKPSRNTIRRWEEKWLHKAQAGDAPR